MISDSQGNNQPAKAEVAGRKPSRVYVFFAGLLLLIAGSMVMHALEFRQQQARLRTTVNISSQPSASPLYFDNRYVGLTPVRLEKVASGLHNLEIVRGGYETWRRRVELSPDSSSIHASLKFNKNGALTITSEPIGAEVILGGCSHGNTPLTIEALVPGKQRLLLRKAGHEMWGEIVLIKAGETSWVEAELENSTLKFLQNAVRANPNALHYWTELGHFLGSRGQDGPSLDAFKAGVAILGHKDVNAGDVRRHFQEMHRQLALVRKDRARVKREMKQAFTALLEKHKDNTDVLKKIGMLLVSARRPDEAAELMLVVLRKTQGTDTRIIQTCFDIGIQIRKMDMLREVLDAAKKAKSLSQVQVYRMAEKCRTSCIRFKGQLRKSLLSMALELFEKCSSLGKSKKYHALGYAGMARSYLLLKDNKQAVAFFKKAANTVFKDGKGDGVLWAQWQLELSKLILEVEGKDPAREVLEEIISRAPKCRWRSKAVSDLKALGGPRKKPDQKKTEEL
jgi:tetratricopeptide (TPR) repeat protein